MSQRHALHDATGVIATDGSGNKLIVIENITSSGVPTDGTVGYAKGCLIFNSGASDDSTNTHIYINIGSATDSNIDALTVN